eukprot:2112833-Rhodomonas_salina.2
MLPAQLLASVRATALRDVRVDLARYPPPRVRCDAVLASGILAPATVSLRPHPGFQAALSRSLLSRSRQLHRFTGAMNSKIPPAS